MAGGQTLPDAGRGPVGDGARLRGAADWPAGTPGQLEIDGVGFPLPFLVRSVEEELLRVTFALDAATAARFSGMPERLAQRRAA